MNQKNLSALQNSDVCIWSIFCINSALIGNASSGRVSEVNSIGRCPLRFHCSMTQRDPLQLDCTRQKAGWESGQEATMVV